MAGRRAGLETKRPRPSRLGGDAGFALVVAIWMAALLAVFALALATANRARVKSVSDEIARAEAEAAAEAGVERALATLTRRLRQGRRGTDGPVDPPCRMPGGQIVAVDITDEAGKVDITIAGEPLLRALLTGLGFTSRRARAVAAAIVDWRDADDEPLPDGAEAESYLSGGRTAGPKNAAFETRRELGAVLGLSAADATRIAPFVTVASGQEGIDPDAAVPGLAAILASGAEEDGSATVARGVTGSADAIPARWRIASAGRAVTIRSRAIGARGGTRTLEAVVTFTERRGRPSPPSVGTSARAGSRRPPPRSLEPVVVERRWADGTDRETVSFSADALTPC